MKNIALAVLFACSALTLSGCTYWGEDKTHSPPPAPPGGQQPPGAPGGSGPVGQPQA